MTYHPGLEGVVAARTRLSHVDGQRGVLVIGGIPVEQLAPHASFEEALHLLWRDRLPSAGELESFRGRLAARRGLPPPTLALLRAQAERKLPVIDALRMGVASLPSSDDAEEDSLRAVAAFPTVVAAYWRLLHGEEPVDSDPRASHAANFLRMLSGESPTAARTRALETYLNTVIDHGLNASTFAARVIISTRSDVVSAVTGAIGALKGPLHGGAPGPALDTVFEIGEPARAEAVLRAKLARGERLMGFGHRVYKVRDPRADVLAAAAKRLYQEAGDMRLYDLATHVEQVGLRLLAEAKPGRNLRTNVEFYTALVLHGLGLPTSLFTPTFAVARVGGWTAHCLEQAAENRLIRPSSEYIGSMDRTWTPLEAR